MYSLLCGHAEGVSRYTDAVRHRRSVAEEGRVLFHFYFTIIIKAGTARQFLGKYIFKPELHGHLNSGAKHPNSYEVDHPAQMAFHMKNYINYNYIN